MTNLFVTRGRLSGIVDWENAGFKPEYWEYIRSMWPYGADKRAKCLYGSAFGDKYKKEYEAELYILKRCSNPPRKRRTAMVTHPLSGVRKEYHRAPSQSNWYMKQHQARYGFLPSYIIPIGLTRSNRKNVGQVLAYI